MAEETKDTSHKPPEKFSNLKVDTGNSKAFFKWYEIRSKKKGPAGRSHCVACVYQSQLYILGGTDLQEGPREDFFVYNFKSSSDSTGWTKVPLKGPFPRGVSHSACVESEGVLYVFGGVSIFESTNDLYEINLETYESKKIAPKGFWPPPLDSHTAVLDPETKKIYVYGGLANYTATSDIYEYNIATGEWTKLGVKGSVPPARSGHASAYHNGSMLIYGGVNMEGDALGDMWEFNFATSSWEAVKFIDETRAPAPRYGHSMIVHKNQALVFGGSTVGSLETNELWKLDLNNKQWEQIHGLHRPEDPIERDTPPTPLKMHSQLLKHKKTGTNFKQGDHIKENSSKGPSLFTLNKSESMRELPSTKKKRQADAELMRTFEKPQRKEPMSPVSTTMSNSIVLRSFTKKSLKELYKGPVQKEEGEIAAKLPCARDGHIAVVYDGRMVIFGGDRHKMSFGDLYCYTID